jgi:hypothetical protein
VHDEGSTSSGGSPHQESSKRNLIVRSLFLDTAIIDLIVMTIAATVTIPVQAAGTGVANTILQDRGVAPIITASGGPCHLATYSWATPNINFINCNCISWQLLHVVPYIILPSVFGVQS